MRKSRIIELIYQIRFLRAVLWKNGRRGNRTTIKWSKASKQSPQDDRLSRIIFRNCISKISSGLTSPCNSVTAGGGNIAPPPHRNNVTKYELNKKKIVSQNLEIVTVFPRRCSSILYYII